MTDPVDWRSITAKLRSAARPFGLDIVSPARVDRYNAVVDAAYQLPPGRDPGGLVVLFGNTRALWAPLLAWRAADKARLDELDPVDTYAAEVVTEVLQQVLPDIPWELRLAPEEPPRRVAMQHLAVVAGVTCLSPSGLSVHPEYGPWLAWRAAAMIDLPGPPTCPEAADPCRPCDKPCMERLERALEAHDQLPETSADIAGTWRRWVAVRDACPIGKEHRYGVSQLRYHYTKDRSQLPQG